MKGSLRLAAVGLGLLMVASLLGCGSGKAKVTGKLLKNGQPLKVASDTLVTLTFSPDTEKKGQTYPANFNHDTGTYSVELPAGKYRVSYVIVEKSQPPITASPEVKNKVYELTGDKEQDIEIMRK